MKIGIDKEEYELDKARMKNIISRMNKAKETKKKTNIVLICLFALFVACMLAYSFLNQLGKDIIEVLCVPYSLGFIFAYLTFDVENVSRYYNLQDELYIIGKQYYTSEDIQNLEEQEIIKEFSKTVKEDR